MSERTWPVIVIGGSGYVGGEMLRLIAAHPNLRLAAAVSNSYAEQPIANAFGHLKTVYESRCFVSIDSAIAMLGEAEHWIVMSAAPHGASAPLVERFIDAVAQHGAGLSIVDASADFRFSDVGEFEQVYGQAHPAPALVADFTCAVPEHSVAIDTQHAAHPGCFATSMLLGIVPLLDAGLVASRVYVSAVTGSTGAGRTPRDTTHHPMRQSNLFAYQVLQHRHAPEVSALSKAATGQDLDLRFVPHSGPFARGIHATIFAHSIEPTSKDRVTGLLTDYYAKSNLVTVSTQPPRIKDVAGSSFAMLSADVDGDVIVVCSVLDNLLKGAAGGSIQWVNRLLGLADDAGLTAPPAGWQ